MHWRYSNFVIFAIKFTLVLLILSILSFFKDKKAEWGKLFKTSFSKKMEPPLENIVNEIILVARDAI